MPKIVNMIGDEIGTFSHTSSVVFELPNGTVYVAQKAGEDEPMVVITAKDGQRMIVSDGCGNSMVRSNDNGMLYVSIQKERN